MNGYLTGIIKQFGYYKMLAEKTFSQLADDKLFLQVNNESNSIAVIVKHLSGNMLSRWTDFLTSDGEKEWRNRDSEFSDDITTRKEMLEVWNKGWDCLFSALQNLTPGDLEKIIYIRNQGQTAADAINRQLAHYSYHIGQIVYIGKMFAGKWESLSIPKGKSADFNADKFAKSKRLGHYTDEI